MSASLVTRIQRLLAERPHSFYEVLQRFETEDYRTVLQAWGDVRRDVALVVDAHGRYRLPEGPAMPPPR
jgi:hypothetical protein